MLEYSRNLKEPSRDLRKNMTEAEQVLWSRLRRKQLYGIQFYRQKPIGPYIVDFYAPAAKLVVEVDGCQHLEVEHMKKDTERDECLADAGLMVIRFDNLQVLQETDAVVEEILRVVEKQQIPPDSPLPKGGEPDPIMLSALEHYAYCPRQCALIHVEQVWSENLYTMRGRDVHERVHDDSSHEQAGVRLERSLPIWSCRLQLTGRADLVEFHGDIPYPVEYKSGSQRRGSPETLQLCAQAICLEEMFGVPVPKGAIFWHGSRERKEIVFTHAMRQQVEEVALKVGEMLGKHITPPPVNDKRCEGCSLRESCLPTVVADKARSRKAARELFVI